MPVSRLMTFAERSSAPSAKVAPTITFSRTVVERLALAESESHLRRAAADRERATRLAATRSAKDADSWYTPASRSCGGSSGCSDSSSKFCAEITRRSSGTPSIAQLRAPAAARLVHQGSSSSSTTVAAADRDAAGSVKRQSPSASSSISSVSNVPRQTRSAARPPEPTMLDCQRSPAPSIVIRCAARAAVEIAARRLSACDRPAREPVGFDREIERLLRVEPGAADDADARRPSKRRARAHAPRRGRSLAVSPRSPPTSQVRVERPLERGPKRLHCGDVRASP